MADDPEIRRRLSPFARASLSVLSATAASAVLAFGFVLMVARFSGPSTRGALAFAAAVPTLLSFISTLGFEASSLYFAAREPDRRAALASLSLIAGTLSGIVLAIVAYAVFRLQPAWVPPEISRELLVLALGITPLMTVQFLLMTLLIGSDRVRDANVVRLSGATFALVCFAVVSTSGDRPSPRAVIVTWVLSQVFAWLTAMILAARATGFSRASAAFRESGRSLRYGLAAHAGNVADVATFRFDSLVLAASRDARELGIYVVAVNIAEILLYLPTSVASVLLPAGARRDQQETARLTRRVTLAVLAVAGVAAAIGLVLAPWGIKVLFGATFAASTAPLRVLLLAMLGTALRRVLWAGAAALNRQGLASAVATLTLALVVVLDLVLIPSHGAIGAAWASFAAYWSGGIIMFAVFRRISPAGPAPYPSLVAEARQLISMLITFRERH